MATPWDPWRCPTPGRPTPTAELGAALLLLPVYFLAGKVGLRLAFAYPSATPVWPATGLAFAALLLYGRRLWPVIFTGAFLVNFTTAGTVLTSLGIAAGNTLEAVIGASLVVRFAGGRRFLSRAETIVMFTLVAALLSTMVSATLGVATLHLGGLLPAARMAGVWTTWWLGDASGGLIITPLLVGWAEASRGHFRWRRSIEAGVLFLGLGLVGSMVFGELPLLPATDAPIGFVCIPFLVWAAVRLGTRTAATGVFLLSLIATWGTLRGYGAFAGRSPNTALLLLQSYLAVTSMMTMMLAAAVTERKLAEERLQELATTDPLTGIGNYRHLIVQMEQEIGRSGRNGLPFSVLFLDVDGLKSINDRHGHLVGSQALRRVADVLRASARASDTAARYGGDEFALVLPETDGAEAWQVGKRIIERLAADTGTPPVRVTLGVAEHPKDGATPDALIGVADRRLYQGKRRPMHQA